MQTYKWETSDIKVVLNVYGIRLAQLFKAQRKQECLPARLWFVMSLLAKYHLK